MYGKHTNFKVPHFYICNELFSSSKIYQSAENRHASNLNIILKNNEEVFYCFKTWINVFQFGLIILRVMCLGSLSDCLFLIPQDAGEYPTICLKTINKVSTTDSVTAFYTLNRNNERSFALHAWWRIAKWFNHMVG